MAAHVILGGRAVLRIRFTSRDIEQVRMVGTLGPIAESVFALHQFGHQRGTRAASWRKQVRERLGDDLPEVQRVCRAHRAVPDLLWLLQRPDEAPGELTGAEARRLAAIVFVFCRSAVLPHWSRVQSQLEAERAVRGRIAITNGIESLFGALHAKVAWHSPVLEVASETDMDISLDGRGLVLCPSLFLGDRNCVFLESEKQTGLPSLVFSVPGDPDGLVDPGAEQESAGDRALGALVGSTRAAALRALTESGTTGDLSERLGLSLSGASKHATVLREAGLITTFRNRTSALHTLTPLGMALLHNGLFGEGRDEQLRGRAPARPPAPAEGPWDRGGLDDGTRGGDGGAAPAAVINLHGDEREQIDCLVTGLASRFASVEDPGFQGACRSWADGLPRRLRQGLLDLRSRRGGALVVRGLDIDDTAIGPTPAGRRPLGSNPTLAYDMAFFLTVCLLGERVRWSSAHHGALMDDVCLVADPDGDGCGWVEADPPPGAPPRPARPGGLVLMCLRNPDNTAAIATDATVGVGLQEILAGQAHRLDESCPWDRRDPRFADAVVRAVEANASRLVLRPGDICLVDDRRTVRVRKPLRGHFDGDALWLRRLNVVCDPRATPRHPVPAVEPPVDWPWSRSRNPREERVFP